MIIYEIFCPNLVPLSAKIGLMRKTRWTQVNKFVYHDKPIQTGPSQSWLLSGLHFSQKWLLAGDRSVGKVVEMWTPTFVQLKSPLSWHIEQFAQSLLLTNQAFCFSYFKLNEINFFHSFWDSLVVINMQESQPPSVTQTKAVIPRTCSSCSPQSMANTMEI